MKFGTLINSTRITANISMEIYQKKKNLTVKKLKII